MVLLLAYLSVISIITYKFASLMAIKIKKNSFYFKKLLINFFITVTIILEIYIYRDYE